MRLARGPKPWQYVFGKNPIDLRERALATSLQAQSFEVPPWAKDRLECVGARDMVRRPLLAAMRAWINALWNPLEHHKGKKPLRSVTCELPWTCLELSRSIIGAGNETRTRDLNLGKVALYQLSYSRVGPMARQTRNCRAASRGVKPDGAKNGAKVLSRAEFPAKMSG